MASMASAAPSHAKARGRRSTISTARSDLIPLDLESDDPLIRSAAAPASDSVCSIWSISMSAVVGCLTGFEFSRYLGNNACNKLKPPSATDKGQKRIYVNDASFVRAKEACVH